MSTLALRLNPEPTDFQLRLFKHHKRAGTSPGNPKWYRPLVVKRFEFKGGPAKYPPLPTGAQWAAKRSKFARQRGQLITTKYKDGTSRTWEPR